MRTWKIAAQSALLLGAVGLVSLGCGGGVPGWGAQDHDRRSALLAAPAGDCGSRFVQGDFDRDGASDYACLYDLGGAEAVILVMPGTASGPTEEVWWRGAAGELDARSCDPFVAGDFTGEGKSDLACVVDTGDSRPTVVVFSSTGSSFTAAEWARGPLEDQDHGSCESPLVSGDLDGDGKADLACLYHGGGAAGVLALISTGAGFHRAAAHHPEIPGLDPARCGSRFVGGDFDGDGRLDLACAYDRGGGSGDVFVLRFREGHFDLETWHAASEGSFDPARCASRFVVGDFNGDGMSDLACLDDRRKGRQHIVVLASDGAGFQVGAWHDGEARDFDASRCDGRFVVGKLDADARDDLVCMYDLGVGSGYPQGRAAQSRLLAFLSTGDRFELAATWPSLDVGPVALDATHCSERIFIGKAPWPYVEGAPWGAVSCAVDYGPLGVGVRHHLLNPELLEFERPRRAVGDPLSAVRGATSFVPRRLTECRAVETLVYDQPTLGHADVEYRHAKRVGDALVLVGATAPTRPFVLWIPPDVTPERTIDGEARYDDGVAFATAFAALTNAHPGMIRLVSFDEPYLFHRPTWMNRNLIRTGYAPFKDVLEDAAETIHAYGIPVWVNFARPEVALMTEKPPVPLNSPHFDFISIDWYHYGTDLLGVADVGAWFEENIGPLLDTVHDLREPRAWGAEYPGQRQHEILVPDGFVFQPWNETEIQNVNDLFYAYSEWARAVNRGQSDPPVRLQAPYTWNEDSVYNGLSAVPRLLRYWDDFNRLPLCP